MTLKMVSNADSAAVCVARLSLFLGEFVCTLNFVVLMNCVVLLCSHFFCHIVCHNMTLAMSPVCTVP